MLRTWQTLCAALMMILFAASAAAQAPSADDVNKLDGELKTSIRKAIKFLHSKRNQDMKTGGWGHPGVCALVALAHTRCPDGYDDSDPFFRQPIDFLLGQQQEDGRIHFQGMLSNYITSVAVLAWNEALAAGKIKDAKRKARVEAALKKGVAFLIELQADEGEGYVKTDKLYGGVGYGGDMRPDLSNTQLALEAVGEAAERAGVKKDDPFFKKAVEFLKRTQNRSESNDQKWAGDDGGFVYYPGKTYAGTYKKADGTEGLRSYGSMTYAGVKSYIYAGLSWDDALVKAALNWIRGNYTVKEHPNMGKTARFYYYHTFAKTMYLWTQAHGTRVIVDAEGVEHDWAYDLGKHMISLQNAEEGWFQNEVGRWMEGDPVLATTYAVLAMNYCYKLKVEGADKGAKKGADKEPKKDAKKDAKKEAGK